MGPPARMPHLRACRLLRLVAQSPRHQALPRQPAPDPHLRRARRALDVVLRRRSLPVGVTGMATVPGPAQQRTAEMFPTLDDAQIDRMRAVGRERAFHTGEILFEQGEPSTKFFVVLEGSLEVVQPFGPGEQLIT